MSNRFKLLFLFFLAGVLSGCAVEHPTTSSSESTSGDDGEIENVPSTDTFAVAVNTNENYDIVISREGDGSTTCSAASGEDVLCVVDIEELDLYYHGLTLNDALPGDLCDYRGFLPYFYQRAPIGYMPSIVIHEVDDEGNILSVDPDAITGIGSSAAAADIWYYINGDWVRHNTLYGSSALTDTNMRCPNDYTNVWTDGQNCCYGTYTRIARVNDGSDITTTTTTPSWGALTNLANCFEGPGIDDYTHKLNTGLPAYLISAVDPTDGLSNTFEVTAPIQKTAIHQHQVYAASYFEPSRHSSDAPTPTRVLRSTGLWYSTYIARQSAYFIYDCLDHAREITARIRVLVREWNLQSELEKLLAGDNTATPDTHDTFETGPGQDDNHPTNDLSPHNDFRDWDDLSQGWDPGVHSESALSCTSFGFAAAICLDTDIFYNPHAIYLGF